MPGTKGDQGERGPRGPVGLSHTSSSLVKTCPLVQETCCLITLMKLAKVKFHLKVNLGHLDHKAHQDQWGLKEVQVRRTFLEKFCRTSDPHGVVNSCV